MQETGCSARVVLEEKADGSFRDCRTGQNVGIKHRAEERQVGPVKGTREEKCKEGKGTGGVD